MLVLAKQTVDFFQRKEMGIPSTGDRYGPEEHYDLVMRWTVMSVLVFFSGFYPLLTYLVPLVPVIALGVKARLASPRSRLHLSIYPLLVSAYIDNDPIGQLWGLLSSGFVKMLSGVARSTKRLTRHLDEPQLLYLQRILMLNLTRVEDQLHKTGAEPAIHATSTARPGVRSSVY